jgi:hypothetical protein
VSNFLADIIPESNRFDIAFANGNGDSAELLESCYKSNFIGAFQDTEEHPEWSRRAAKFTADEFLHDTPGRIKLFGDVAPLLADDGIGKCSANFRHALELWDGKGIKPFSNAQDFGSCVDASCGEHETALFGWRAAHPEALAARGDKPETFKHCSAWYKYADRGYCSDGWSGSGIATVARRVGVAFRIKYDLASNSIDFTDDDENERIVARQWCRTGIPSWIKEYTAAHHAYADGAITKFQGGVKEIRKLCAAGGVLHTSGTKTSGSSKPFVVGPVGPHMQSLVGCDDSDEGKKWFRDKVGTVIGDDDSIVLMGQTWGAGWKGECADEYWPRHLYGEKPQGTWVWTASQIVRHASLDYSWLPWAVGFAAVGPTPAPGVNISGDLYAEQVGAKIAIRGELKIDQNYYIVIPKVGSSGVYNIVPKPLV